MDAILDIVNDYMSTYHHDYLIQSCTLENNQYIVQVQDYTTNELLTLEVHDSVLFDKSEDMER